MNLSIKIFLTAVALVLLIGLGVNAWNYFAYGGLTGSFLSVAIIAMAYGVVTTGLGVSIHKIWSKA